MDKIYAHSRAGFPKETWEELKDHGSLVAEMAACHAAAFGFGKVGFIAGALHDIGKMARMFQGYIGGACSSGGDHSLAGALIVRENIKAWQAFLGPVIAGHHTGLQDVSVHMGRIAAKKVSIPAGWEAHAPELPDLAGWKAPFAVTNMPGPKGFGRAFLTRMLFSALVHAGADRNLYATPALEARFGHPLTRVRIETRTDRATTGRAMSPAHAGAD